MFEVIWGKSVIFGDPEQKLYMTYYGIFVLSTFIGVGQISKRPPAPKETFKPRMA
jgi:hypothetical protein